MFVISFFRDTLTGFWYLVYVLCCIFFIFVLLGVVGDRKRAVIEEKIKKKRKEDIVSGREAMLAARQSKQILDVMSDAEINSGATSYEANSDVATNDDKEAKEEVPAVLVIDGNANSQEQSKVTNNGSNIQKVVTPISNPNVSTNNSNQ